MKYWIVIIVVSALFACGNSDGRKNSKTLPSSSGKYGEVLVVIDTLYENGKSGDVIEEIFFQAVEGLPQQEPMFRMATVNPGNLKSILKRSRNILKVNISKGRKSSIRVEEDVWAKDQLLIHITASTDNEAASILQKNKERIRDYFNEREIERLQRQYSIKPKKEYQDEIKRRFGLSLVIPPGYMMMDTSGNGLWLKKEKQIGQHQLMQGIMIYEEDYDSDSAFTTYSMINSRDSFTSTHVEGMRENAFMAVYKEYQPQAEEVNLNNVYAVEFRGLWNMTNDFMGGPYIHYILVDENRQKVIHLDGFVYGPKFNKREYVRELEALLRTAELLPPA